MTNFISRIKLISSLLFLVAFMTGCLSTTYQRHYQGDLKPLSEVAIIMQMDNPATSFIDYVDGIDTHTSLNKGFGRLAVTGLQEITPGKHIICAGYQKYLGSNIYRDSKGCSNIELNAMPGHVYFLYPRFQTHSSWWEPDIWDITGDLHTKELEKLTGKIDKILRGERGGNAKSILSVEVKQSVSPLKGFGEEVKSKLNRWLKKDITVSYKFDRYVPYIVAKADNGIEYHLEIDQHTGFLNNVFGKNVYVGSGLSKELAFQPINSKFAYTSAYTYVSGGNVKTSSAQKWEEQNDGSYIKVK